MVLTTGTTHYDIRSMSDNIKDETNIIYKTSKIRVGVQAVSYRLPVQEALFHNYGSKWKCDKFHCQHSSSPTLMVITPMLRNYLPPADGKPSHSKTYPHPY
jgi:hypothetical protein